VRVTPADCVGDAEIRTNAQEDAPPDVLRSAGGVRGVPAQTTGLRPPSTLIAVPVT
jgi:hypothetical protein